MRSRACVGPLLTVALIACSLESTAPPSSVTVPDATLLIRVPETREAELVARDTVTLTAVVYDTQDREIETGVVEWSGGAVKSTGPRTALLVVPDISTEVVAVFKRAGRADLRAGKTIAARYNRGEALIWTPGGEIVFLPPPPAGARLMDAVSINDHGEVTGTVDYLDFQRAFVWSERRGYRELAPELPSRSTVAVAINNNGVVAGRIHSQFGRGSMFVWSEAAGMTEIPPHPSTDTFVADINAAGDVTGNRGNGPFIWTPEVGFRELVHGVPSVDAPEIAVDLNDNGEVLLSGNGRFDSAVDYNWGFPANPAIWRENTRSAFQCGDCVLADMNNSRAVVGNMLSPERQGFRWTAQEGLRMLLPGPGKNSEGYAINEGGVAAGAI